MGCGIRPYGRSDIAPEWTMWLAKSGGWVAKTGCRFGSVIEFCCSLYTLSKGGSGQLSRGELFPRKCYALPLTRVYLVC